MRKKIVIMLAICLLTGLVSGCGAEENNLTEDNNTAVFEEGSEPETDDTAESDNERQQVEQTIETAEESPDRKQEELVLKGLDWNTLEIVCYTDADGNKFYITEEKALQEIAALLGSLHGVPRAWKPDWRSSNYCKISVYTTERGWDSVVYEGNKLYRSSNSSFRMQDDFEEVLAGILYFTSPDYLLSLVEPEEEQQIIQGILEEEDSQLVRLVVNRLEELNCCLFETSEGQGLEFHLLLWGSWEGKEVRQHQILFLNEEERDWPFPLEQLSEWCEVKKEDMDFDGSPDLLIYEGSSSGTGGYAVHYRVIRWDESQGQFTYYPSFPFWITWLDLENKQVIDRGHSGVLYYEVRIYSVVDGEYRVVQELTISEEYVTEEGEGETDSYWKKILSYYENGELVREYDVTGMDWDEMEELCKEEGLSEIFSYTQEYG